MNGQVNEESAEYVIRFILDKNLSSNPPDHIKLIINSEGGALDEGFAIMDMMDSTPIPIHTYALGKCYSAGLFIFMNGEPGYRYVFNRTTMMTHQWSGTMDGKEHELKAWEKASKVTTKIITDLYEEKTGMSRRLITKKLLGPTDVYMDANEAIKYGFADEIVDVLEFQRVEEEITPDIVDVILETTSE